MPFKPITLLLQLEVPYYISTLIINLINKMFFNYCNVFQRVVNRMKAPLTHFILLNFIAKRIFIVSTGSVNNEWRNES